jgi:putative ABC transport system permease protein
LGASRGDILQLFSRDVLRFAGAGIAVGLVLAAGVAAILRAIVFEVNMLDAVSFAMVGGLLLGVALLAGTLTARRATRVDPMVALRSD